MAATTYHALPRSFYAAAPATVAPNLLGHLLIRRLDKHILVGRIVETEAYLASGDPAAHSFVGRTARNAALYGNAGYAYVHAMRHHYLLDVVTETVGQPSSILIRALEPIASIEIMQGLRKTPGLLKLTSGPGRLCQALGIDQRLNLHDLTDEHSSLFIAAEWHVVRSEMIGTSARTGISKNADAPLRFFAKDNPYVSGRS